MLTLLLLLPLTLALHPPTKSATCPVLLPQDPPSTRVVNGDLLSPTLTPYLVLIPFNETDPDCTGVLVSSTWFLTAAQCRVSIGTSVAIGVSKMADMSPTNTRNISSLHPHPFYDFNTTREFDMAAYELSAPAPAGSKFMAVNVAERPAEKSPVRLLGYGHVATNTSGSGVGRQVDMPVVTLADCKTAYPGLIEEEYNFCAGYSQGGCDSCNGDAGAPLIQYNDDTPVVVGLVSWGRGCAQAGSPGVNVRTKPFEEFLDSQGVVYTKATEIVATEPEDSAPDPDDGPSDADDNASEPVDNPDADANPEGDNDGNDGSSQQVQQGGESNNDDDGNGLGVGAIIGIVVGALTVVTLVILAVIYFVARRKQPDNGPPPPSLQHPVVPILPLGAAANAAAMPGQTPPPGGVPQAPPTPPTMPQAASATPPAQPGPTPAQVAVQPQAAAPPMVPVQHAGAAQIGSQGFAARPPMQAGYDVGVQYVGQGAGGVGGGVYQGYGQPSGQ